MPATATFPSQSGRNDGFNFLPLGAGGFVTGLDFSADGTRAVHTTDVGGAYIKDFGVDDRWRTLLTTDSLLASEYDPGPGIANYQAGLSDGPGTYCAIISPANKDHILVGLNAHVYRTTNGGLNFLRVNLPAKKMLANFKEQRHWQRKFAYHPTDTNTFIIGTQDGQYITTNGGSSFSACGVPAGAAKDDGVETPHLVAFDPGAPSNVFISRHGTGVYRSTTGGAAGSFTHITGGPTSVRQMKVLSNGTLMLCTVEGTMWKLARGSTTWQEITGWPSNPMYTFAVDPANLDSIVGMHADGGFMRSTDGGQNWVADKWQPTYPGPVGIYINATDIPWLGDKAASFFPSELLFQPGQTNKVWAAHGLGLAWSNPPSTFVRWDWTDESFGNEELIVLCALSVEGNPVTMFGTADKAIFRPKNMDAPLAHPIFLLNPNQVQVNHCYDIARAPEDPNYLVTIINYNQQQAGFSRDGGKTWEMFEAQHPDGAAAPGGCIACTGVDKIIWVPGNKAKAVRSSDGGKTWQYINMGGSSGGIVNWINSLWTRRYIVTADLTQPGRAWIVINNGSGPTETQTIGAGVFETLDHGATWTRKFTGVIDSQGDGAQFWANRLQHIPGKANELLFCSGAAADFPNSRLMHSSNGANSFTPLRETEIKAVNFFAFGAKMTESQSYPTVYLDATVNGVEGIYRSTDFFATTPELLDRFPAKEIMPRAMLHGDMNKPGRVYVGLSGKGLLYGNFA